MNRKIISYLIAMQFAALISSTFGHTGETKALFNGKNLEGWKIENGGTFFVENGLLKINKGTGWLRSVDTFKDFTLTTEVRFLEEEANSGVFVRTGPTSKSDENGWPDNGYQVQLQDNLVPPAPLATMIPYGAPPFEHVSDLEKIKATYTGLNEWQILEITCVGETMTVKLNGELVTISVSIQNLDGHIGIQGENGVLEFRKIEVEILN